MDRHWFRLALAALLTAQGGWGQEKIGRWKTFTDMKSVRAVAARGNDIAAATSGGVFVVTNATAIAGQFTNSEGLPANDATAIAIEPDGTLWVGFQNGSIALLKSGDESWQHIRDISQSGFVQKRIRKFLIEGDTLFVGSDFGVSVYRPVQTEFGDTYANFGFTGQTGVNDVLVWGSELWIATDRGIARAPRFATNLPDPNLWTRYGTADGLPAANVRTLRVFNDTLVAGTTAGVAFFDGAGFQTIPSFAGAQVMGMEIVTGQLLIASNTPGVMEIEAISTLSGPVTIVAQDSGVTGNDFAVGASGMLWVGTASRGITGWTGTAWRSMVPNGPQSNLFSSLAVDGNSVVWCASGISGQGRGFYRYNPHLPEGNRWKNFTVADVPLMGSNDYFEIGVGSNGSVWAMSWGEGAVEVRGDSVVRKLDTQSTPRFSTSDANDPTYPVINGVAIDPQGKTWFVNWAARNRNFLARLTSDTTFEYHTHPIVTDGRFTSVVIDEFGTKWLANAEPFHPAKGLYLYYFNESGVVSGTVSTGGWGFMTEADGLPNNTVLSVAADVSGNVCVGTERGFMIISDPLFPKQRKFSSFPLREQTIQAIAVDAVDQKWVGTKEGLFVMNADATQILQQYTVDNTEGKLLDNDIRSLAIDHQRGIVYIGTERGLSSLTIEPVAVSRVLTTLNVGPNPFVIPAGERLEIRNLAAGTSIKILNVNGALISEFAAQGGGRAFWDGKNRRGELVGSGIYFIVAFSGDGDEIATGKVAVVRN